MVRNRRQEMDHVVNTEFTKNAAIFSLIAGPTQINLQVPDDASAGTVAVAVTTASGTSATYRAPPWAT